MENIEGLPGGGWICLCRGHAKANPERCFRAAKVVDDGQVWIDMLDHRNLLARTYSLQTFDEAVGAIHARYLAAIEKLQGFFQRESLK